MKSDHCGICGSDLNNGEHDPRCPYATERTDEEWTLDMTEAV
jgi:hypothetical protein